MTCNHYQLDVNLNFHKAGICQLRAIVSRMNNEVIAISNVGAFHSTIAELTEPWQHPNMKRLTAEMA